MRSICPLSVPSSGEYVYVTAEPISLPYSRLLLLLLHPPLIFPSVPQRCHRRSSFPSVYCPSVSLSLPTSLPIALWLYQVWSQRPVRLAQRHCLPLSLSLSLSLSLARTHTYPILARDFHVWKLGRTGLPVDQYRYRYYSRVKRASLIYSGIIFDDGGRRRGKVYISEFIGVSFFLVILKVFFRDATW